MIFDFAHLRGAERVKLLSATIVPRPIAWIVTQEEGGALNAAPFSFFNLFSGDPPVICVGIGGRSGGLKDTARNIERTGEFVINLVSEGLAQKMNVTAIDFPPGVDEVLQAGLSVAPSIKVKPPRIADSPVAFECIRLFAKEIGAGRSIIAAEVVAAYIRDDAILDAERCHVDTPRLKLIARMHGGGQYVRCSDVFEMKKIELKDWSAETKLQR
ncbi:flavin reductase (DIM6/NTAB) family NADH-FMN oxidoreductase RutF [Xanthobacter flavus]|nr:flavin reductase family protein [Xanthobacter flavus]MBN8918109.1 flavin reductase family protein [Hyphomicrobiales bacterium]MDR6335531.1 flavin reductase (DIM6/NTAB) family NADH-FMN oxidoreductase RutF [Xanthobacter flavus]